MGLCVISDALTAVGSAQGFCYGISKFILNWRKGGFNSNFSSSASSRDQCDGAPQIPALTLSTDAAVAPVGLMNLVKTLPRRNIKTRRRTKRKTVSGDDGYRDFNNGYGYEELFEFFVGGGDARGPFDYNNNNNNNNNFGGGSGKGGNFGGFGGFNWGDFSSNESFYDPAFDFVYEILSWIVLTNCLHFAYKNVQRIRANRYAADPVTEKLSGRLVPVC